MSQIHLTKNGKPDMRYKSSREYVKSQQQSISSETNNNPTNNRRTTPRNNMHHKNNQKVIPNDDESFKDIHVSRRVNTDPFINYQFFKQDGEHHIDDEDKFLGDDNSSLKKECPQKRTPKKSTKQSSELQKAKRIIERNISNDSIKKECLSPPSTRSSRKSVSSNSPRSPGSATSEDSFLYNSSNLRLNQDGTIDKSSKAVKSGDISFNPDGSVDRNCKAIRLGYLHLNSIGNPDLSIHKDLEIPKNPGQHKTKVYRDSYQQKKFRKEVNCPKDHDASHIVDLELAREILKSKPGRHPSEESLRQSMKPLNKLLEARPASVNRPNPSNPDNDHAMALRIMKLIHGERVVRTRALDEKILQMRSALQSIPPEEMNPQIKFILKEIEKISPVDENWSDY
ncbi:hypothetical protein M9Y10_023564 [Tritrichomonas musculus]|uniref:Uncharacterized protein n=1 Tax=Tritrichomonas musculus TaxID=1915356 RepID=A0ABR2KW22_9EUKA